MSIVVKFIFTLLLIIALAEAGSYAALYSLSVSDKSFSEIYDPTGNTARFRGQCDDFLQTLELNPYLAFTHNKKCSGPGKGEIEYQINNLGLLGQDAEFIKAQFYTIGIFGGSVAAIFAGYISTPQLEEILNSCFNSKSGKPFRVLNFSDGAWKHPQQIIALAIYGDYVDTAISIEGFNEHYMLMPGNRTDILLPASNYSSLMNNDFFTNYYFMLSNLKENSISKSNTIKLFTLLFRKNLEKRGFDNSYSKLMEKYLMPNYVDVHEHNVKSYIGFVKSFDAIAASKNIYSLIVLQPVPLHKPLSNAEANVVRPLDYEGPYQEIASLIENHARAFINLSDLFSKTDRTVFSDQIHFLKVDKNGRSYGNYRMAVEVIHRLGMDNEIISRTNSAKCIAKHEPL